MGSVYHECSGLSNSFDGADAADSDLCFAFEGFFYVTFHSDHAALVVMVAALRSQLPVNIDAHIHSDDKGVEAELDGHGLAAEGFFDYDFGGIGLARFDCIELGLELLGDRFHVGSISG